DSNLYAVASRSLEKAHAFASQHKVEKAYGSYTDLMNDPKVDIIYIATPHNSHAELSIQCMEAGRAVLCEKAFALNRIQAEQMVAASKKNNVFLMEAFWTRFNPSIKKILSMVKEGAIGEVNYIQADFTFYKDAPVDGRLLNMDLAGGALLDIGVYPIFLAYLIMGKPRHIVASSIKHETGADLQTAIRFDYPQGYANLFCSMQAQTDMQAKICGPKGAILIPDRWHQPNGFTLMQNYGKEHFDLPKLGLGYSYEIQEAQVCLQEGKIESDLWTHQNSIDLISICDEIRELINLKYPSE
ncbi:MAG: Gfo/Idh/MocA family oxidoreductase, partial [Bacteroidota bacterium]